MHCYFSKCEHTVLFRNLSVLQFQQFIDFLSVHMKANALRWDFIVFGANLVNCVQTTVFKEMLIKCNQMYESI